MERVKKLMMDKQDKEVEECSFAPVLQKKKVGNGNKMRTENALDSTQKLTQLPRDSIINQF